MMRIYNSLRNSGIAILFQIILLALSFWSRTIFIKTLGAEYLGMYGLFSNILAILSLIELGLGTALTYTLYKPMTQRKYNKIVAYLFMFRRIYLGIAGAMIIAGLILVMFLDYLIFDSSYSLFSIKLYFLVYLLSVVATYFFVYKSTVFVVDQKEYIVSVRIMGFTIIKYLLEIAILLLTNSFMLYLFVSLFTNVSGNIAVSMKANKMYPEIFRELKINGKFHWKNEIATHELDSFKKNIGAMMYHRIGNVVVNGTDNLLISKMLGLYAVGLYSNYILIVNALNTLVGILYNSLNGSIGNLVATESVEKKVDVYKKILFSNYWMASNVGFAIVVLINPFIKIWVGGEFVLSSITVLIIALNSFLLIARKTPLVFRNAMGLFQQDKIKPIVEAILNLIFSIILGMKFGLNGIILGTTISTLTTSYWVEPYILFKFGFKSCIKEHYKVVYKFVIALVLTSPFYYVLELLGNKVSSWVEMVMLVLLTVFIINIMFMLTLRKENEFEYFLRLLGSFLNKINRKKIDKEKTTQ